MDNTPSIPLICLPAPNPSPTKKGGLEIIVGNNNIPITYKCFSADIFTAILLTSNVYVGVSVNSLDLLSERHDPAGISSCIVHIWEI